MRNNRWVSLCTGVVLTLVAAITHAEVKGSYTLQQGKQKLDLYYLDDTHMRANFADQAQLVVKGSQSWLLHRQGTQWLAMDADQAAALLQATQGAQAQQSIPAVTMRDTGRQEVVAGYKGKVFELHIGDKITDLVLTDSPDVLALTNGWRALALKLSHNLGAQQSAQLQQTLAKIPQQGFGGLLRQGNDLTLVALTKDSNAHDVDFPANTQVLPTLKIPGL